VLIRIECFWLNNTAEGFNEQQIIQKKRNIINVSKFHTLAFHVF
jgi:hypothetical protein